MGQARDRARTREERAVMAIERDRLIQEEQERKRKEDYIKQQERHRDLMEKLSLARNWLEENYELALEVETNADGFAIEKLLDCGLEDTLITKTTSKGIVNVCICSYDFEKKYEVIYDENAVDKEFAVSVNTARKPKPRRSSGITSLGLAAGMLMAGTGLYK